MIDLLNGVVVQGVGGKRSEYRAISSMIAASPDPSVVLQAFESFAAVNCCYIADLDGLQGRALNRCTLAELARSPLKLIVDGGVACVEDAEELFDLGADSVVVASESLPDLSTARDLLAEFGSQRLLFSLDLVHGEPLVRLAAWKECNPIDIVHQLADVGYRRFIALDLAAVGMNHGPATLDLCDTVVTQRADVDLISGGGIRGMSDIEQFRACGCAGVLVSSALHSGAISPDNTWGAKF